MIAVWGSVFSSFVQFQCASPIDLEEYTEIEGGGCEVFYNGQWVECTFLLYDPETSTDSIFAVFDVPSNTVGLSYRTSAPLSGLTAGGIPIGVLSGVVGDEQPAMKMAAKIADFSLLTEKFKSR